ncbi:MAG: hypothetical protein PHC75_05615 [Burkholderiales bacterium]|nr:hypothetical protein [Burkholderiales bacterium]
MNRFCSIAQLSKIITKALLGCFIIALVACGSSGENQSFQSSGIAITIDNAGVIPVFAAKPTSTVIYVHNNSAANISGISYSVVNDEMLGNTGSVDGIHCAAIAAGQSCALKIVTPNLTLQQEKGSMLIKANYMLDKQDRSFSQLINYVTVDASSNKKASGIKFKSGATIYGYGNSTAYATVYLYNSDESQNYTITDLNINQPSLKLNMDFNKLTLPPNSVQAIEVSSPILTSSISASLTVKSSSTSSDINLNNHDANSHSVSNGISLSVEPVAAGAILIAGSVPLIDTTKANVSMITFLNTGNKVAVTGITSADNGLFGLSNDCDNQTLQPGASCTISFQYTESGGSGTITVPYTGGSSNSAFGNATWFNGKGSALVSVTIADNPLSFSATVWGRTEVTVTNVGGYTLNNIAITNPRVIGGSAIAEIIPPSSGVECINGSDLPIGSSCTYFVAVNDSITDLDQQINLGFSANYTGTNGLTNYSRVSPLIYSSTSYGAIIALSTISPMSISGNNLESASQGLVISNNGAAVADLTSFGLINNPAYLFANSGDCSSSLASGSSCTAQIKLGPVSSSLESSGVANYVVDLRFTKL